MDPANFTDDASSDVRVRVRVRVVERGKKKGLSVAFVKKVPRVIGFKKHSLLWVSVADPEGLAAAIGK